MIDLGMPKEIGQMMVPSGYRKHLEMVVRQRVFEELRKDTYSKLILASEYPEDPITVFFPEVWIKWLKGKGLQVNAHSSRWLRWKVISYTLLQGLRRWGRLFLTSMTDSSVNGLSKASSFAMLVSMFPGASPQNSEEAASHRGIATWYRDGKLRLKNEDIIITNIPNGSNKIIDECLQISSWNTLGLKNWGKRLRFLASGFGIVVASILQTLSGRWWAAFILRDAIELAYYSLYESDQLASTYVFIDPHFARRPLWTFYAEGGGSRIILTLYSLNNQVIQKQGEEKPPYMPGWGLVNWPHYAVWDIEHKAFIENFDKINAEIDVVGPILLSDSVTPIPQLPKKTIAVFDVSVFRKGRYVDIGYPQNYYIDEVLKEFLEVVYEIVTRAGYTIAYKPKRYSDMYSHAYLALVRDFSLRDGVVHVDAGISPDRLLDAVDAAISIPFTSTAFIARNKGLKSVHFNPSNLAVCENGFRHGIPVLGTKKALERWVASLDDEKAP
ncbi:MAG: polysaccharide biosynthesis PFTS motif protein [Mariprofundaceae bacterium]|nr:polysaccharide biosynthesis PFTS motif protein [Mariprofundaceae bacterium]